MPVKTIVHEIHIYFTSLSVNTESESLVNMGDDVKKEKKVRSRKGTKQI